MISSQRPWPLDHEAGLKGCNPRYSSTAKNRVLNTVTTVLWKVQWRSLNAHECKQKSPIIQYCDFPPPTIKSHKLQWTVAPYWRLYFCFREKVEDWFYGSWRNWKCWVLIRFRPFAPEQKGRTDKAHRWGGGWGGKCYNQTHRKYLKWGEGAGEDGPNAVILFPDTPLFHPSLLHK